MRALGTSAFLFGLPVSFVVSVWAVRKPIDRVPAVAAMTLNSLMLGFVVLLFAAAALMGRG